MYLPMLNASTTSLVNSFPQLYAIFTFCSIRTILTAASYRVCRDV
jgi:hypothetical protein